MGAWARFRDSGGGLTALDISDDKEFLLTASEDGAARLWPLGGAEVEIRRPAAAFVGPGEEVPAVSAARLGPGPGPRRVATGNRAGYVFLREWAAGGRRSRADVGRLDGEISALALSPDGRWLAASASRERSIRFWAPADGAPPRAVPFAPRVHHDEQVGSLAAWPDGSLFVGGGDDAAVRFWDLRERTLAGTLLAQARNSYLLAARRGEPTTEADALGHGLLTYALLRGMGAAGLKAIPADLGGLPGPPSADFNRDGLVTTDEIVAFADDALPRLARMFPRVVLRAGAGRTPPGPDPAEVGPELEQKLRLQSAEVSFPLVTLPEAGPPG